MCLMVGILNDIKDEGCPVDLAIEMAMEAIGEVFGVEVKSFPDEETIH